MNLQHFSAMKNENPPRAEPAGNNTPKRAASIVPSAGIVQMSVEMPLKSDALEKKYITIGSVKIVTAAEITNDSYKNEPMLLSTE